jgi:glutathione S-transferase
LNELAKNPAFTAYCLTTVCLCLNMLGLWGFSGGARTKSKTTLNPEDQTTVAKGAELITQETADVARVLRAHTNAFVNIMPFLVMGLLYVILGASATMAWAIFGAFAFFRWVHTFAYLGGKQPWRTLSFALGGITTLVLMEEVTRYALAAR